MLQRLGQLSATRPWRSLLVLLVFVVLAGVIGGPVAGRLDGGDGFTPADAESSQATTQLERATGEETSPGVILLVRGDDAAAQAAATELAAVPGVARAEPGPTSENGDSHLVMGTLRAGVDDELVATDAIAAFEGREDIVVGGGAVVGAQLGETISEDLARAELFAFPLLVLLSLLFFRGRAALLPLVVGITTVLGTFLVLSVGEPRLRPERLRPEPRDRARARPRDRLHAVPGHALPRGAGERRRAAGRRAHHDEHRRPHDRLLGRDRRRRARHPDAVPARLRPVRWASPARASRSSPASPRCSSLPRCSRSGATSWPARSPPSPTTAGTASRTPSCAGRA